MSTSNKPNFITRILTFLRISPHVHLRQGNIASELDLLELFDRFVVGGTRYPLEWDDFISWEGDTPYIEEIRVRLGAYEKFLFSRDPRDREVYQAKVIEERNEIARSLGVSLRN